MILHHWEIGPKTIYSTISQKVGDGFRWNLVDRLGVWQGQSVSILVKIQIWIWIWELFNFQSDSSPLRDWAKNDIILESMIFTSATKGKGGYVFTPFCLSVCVSVYRISQKVVDGSGWNFVDRSGVWQGQTDYIFMTIQIRIRRPEFFEWFFTIGPKTIYSTISQKVVVGFGRNLVETLGVSQGRIASISVKIRIRIRIW